MAEDVLADRGAEELAQRYRFASRLVTTGRGYAYPTARETALKLTETSYLPAIAFPDLPAALPRIFGDPNVLCQVVSYSD